jgi:hypothetical protein
VSVTTVIAGGRGGKLIRGNIVSGVGELEHDLRARAVPAEAWPLVFSLGDCVAAARGSDSIACVGCMAEAGMDRRKITLAIGAGGGAVVGVLIADLSHLTGYWPHVVIAVAAAAGGILVPLVFDRK